MTQVELKGWLTGLNKISLNYLLRRYTGLGLVEASHRVDLLLAGEQIVVECADEATARLLCEQADRIGADCFCTSQPESFDLTTRTSPRPAPLSPTHS
jgi:hypothetical protein